MLEIYEWGKPEKYETDRWEKGEGLKNAMER